MNTIEREEEFDYQAYTRATPPDSAQIQRGLDARQRRFEAAMQQRTVRIDEDILAQIQQRAVADQSREQLVNQALREWLAAQGMKELVRAEIQAAVRQSLANDVAVAI